MAGFQETQALLHKIRVKLYPNYLNENGKYIARTDDERSVSVEQICGNLRERGSFIGNPEDAANNIHQFCEECGFLVCDGWSLNMKYYSIHPRVGGTWDRADEASDREKHPVSFSFRVLKPLRDLADRIVLEVESIAEAQAYIDQITDVSSGTVDETLTPGGMVVIEGNKIKVAGTKPGVGIVITGARAGGTPYTNTIAPPYAENNPAKIIAILPSAIPEGTFKIQITTQYASGGTLLKEPRTILSSATFVIGPPAQTGESSSKEPDPV
jgi:hypothetical protein